MAIEVELPDGTIVEFPDNTPSNVMEGALKQYKAKPKASPQDLQARAAQGDKGAAQEFADRYKASMGQDYKPADGTEAADGSWLGANFTPAMGSTLGDTGNGLMQNAIEGGPMGNMVKAGFNAVGIQQPKNPLQDWIQSRIAEKRSLDAPLMNSEGGTRGSVAGNMLQLATPGATAKLAAVRFPAAAGVASAFSPTTYAGNAALGGVMGAIQPRTADESQAKNIGYGAGFGLAGQFGANRLSGIAKGGSEKLSDMQHELYQKAKELDIPVTAAQLSDSRVLKWLQGITKDIPFTGAASINKKQVDSLTRATSRLFGENTDALTPKVLEGIDKKIGDTYDSVFNGLKVKIDKPAFKQYEQLVKEGEFRLEPQERKMLAALSDRVKSSMKNGELDGPLYQNLRLKMKDLENGTQYGNAVKEFRKILEGAAERSAPADKAGLLKKADAMYRDKKLVDKLMTRADTMDVKTATEGKVNPSMIWGLEHGKYGASPRVDDLGRIGQMIKDTAPNSGTQPRTFFSGLMGDTVRTVAGIGGGIPMGRILNSPKLGKYVAEGAGKRAVTTAKIAGDATKLTAQGSTSQIPKKPASRSVEIRKIALEDAKRGPEILSSLPKAEQMQAAIEFAKKHKINPGEVMRRINVEAARKSQLMSVES